MKNARLEYRLNYAIVSLMLSSNILILYVIRKLDTWTGINFANSAGVPYFHICETLYLDFIIL